MTKKLPTRAKLKDSNVLYFGCPHLPFEHEHFLEFLVETQQRCKCKKVVCLGDLIDNHSISYHEHDPNGWAPLKEMQETDKHLLPWKKAFPVMTVCRGNHDSLVDRKAKTVGLPKRCFKDFRDIWEFPAGWKDGFECVVNNVRGIHGTKRSGKMAHVNLAVESMMSAVMAHIHSNLGVNFIEQVGGSTFGMAVGCGVDDEKYAFAYGAESRYKSIVGCGVTTDNGRHAQVFRMKT